MTTLYLFAYLKDPEDISHFRIKAMPKVEEKYFTVDTPAGKCRYSFIKGNRYYVVKHDGSVTKPNGPIVWKHEC